MGEAHPLVPHLKTMKFLFFTLTVAISVLSSNAAPTLMYSPDKSFVVAWYDSDMGAPIGQVRSILLKQLPHGDTPFSLVTSPRDTRAFWSPDSKKCLIIDGPDDGGPRTWLFVAKDSGPQPNAIKVEPLKTIQDHFYAHSTDLWRGDIVKVKWLDNKTLSLDAFDNDGSYKMIVKIDAPDKPIISKRP
jgi:hypothetical protein